VIEIAEALHAIGEVLMYLTIIEAFRAWLQVIKLFQDRR
jgi:hypothetical protein